jgi:HD-GYP domain-containing protein (c-di-GMP phosphodiesterase class II)
LVTRLAITGLVISVVLGLVAIIIEHGKVGEVVLDRALQGAVHFNTQAGYLLDKPGLPDHKGIQRELNAFASRGLKQRIGHFVFVRIFDPDSIIVAKNIDVNYTDIEVVEKHMDASDMRLPGKGENWHEIIRIHGAPYIKVGVPLTNSGGDVVAYAEGVFTVSSDAVADARNRALRTVFIVIAIVLVTTGLIYPVIIKLMSRLTKLSVRLLDSHMETLKVLGGAIATRDSDTDAHNYRVTIFSVRLAETISLDRKIIRTLIKGAFLHDVGKIGIPDNILLKPGRLTETEFEIMKTHVLQGLDIIERSGWLKDSADIVGYHHEKLDGSGYPKGFGGEKVPITARIFAVADVFDALISRRPYKKSFSFEETMKIIEENRGNHFDPGLIDSFTFIAKSLYDDFAGCNDDKLKKEVEAITQQYFSGDIDTIFTD